MKEQFFISYARPDAQFAKTLAETLSGSFLAPRDIALGEQWLRRIADELAASKVIVVLHSAHTQEAHYQLEEILQALAFIRSDPGIRKLVPVCLDGTPLLLGLQSFQAIPFDRVGSPHDVAIQLRQVLPRAAWEHYDALLSTWPGYKVAYVPIINDMGGKWTQYSFDQVSVTRTSQRFVLPEAFRDTPISSPQKNEKCCRLVSYALTTDGKIRLQFGETTYEDYLRSGEHLDDPCPPDGKQTFREAFGSLGRDQHGGLRTMPLTNICGVGVFVLTRENEVVVAQHSAHSHVYPGRWTYSASGVMKFGASPHPFTEIQRKAFEEIGHQSNPTQLKMVGFGVDARKLFFQCSFIEKTDETLDEIKARVPDTSIIRALDLEPNAIAEDLTRHCWEPAAEAALLCLAAARYSPKEVADAMSRLRVRWPRRAMSDEWDYRASQSGELPDMSVRYPRNKLTEIAVAFTESQMQFIGEEARDKSVVEVGCGTGRLTEKLRTTAARITSLDLCERMLERARARLGRDQNAVDFLLCFAQDYQPQRHDLVVCSRVLIHNVSAEDFGSLVGMMCRSAPVVYLFEDVTPDRATSPHSSLRSADVLKSAFERQSFTLTRQEMYSLCEDQMAFMRFERTHEL